MQITAIKSQRIFSGFPLVQKTACCHVTRRSHVTKQDSASVLLFGFALMADLSELKLRLEGELNTEVPKRSTGPDRSLAAGGR